MTVDRGEVVLPSWFKAETGFAFCDEMGDHYILLGKGRYTEYDYKGSLSLYAPDVNLGVYDLKQSAHTLVAVLVYRGEFSLVNLTDKNYNQAFWNSCRPAESRVPGSLLVLENADHRSAKQTWSK